MDQCLSEWSQLGNHWLLHRHLKSDEGYWRHLASTAEGSKSIRLKLVAPVEMSLLEVTCSHFQAFMSSSFKHLQAIGRLDRLSYTKSH